MGTTGQSENMQKRGLFLKTSLFAECLFKSKGFSPKVQCTDPFQPVFCIAGIGTELEFEKIFLTFKDRGLRGESFCLN